MRYLLLIYEEPPAAPMAPDDWATMMAQYGAFTTWLEERGWLRTAAALQDVATATTVNASCICSRQSRLLPRTDINSTPGTTRPMVSDSPGK